MIKYLKAIGVASALAVAVAACGGSNSVVATSSSTAGTSTSAGSSTSVGSSTTGSSGQLTTLKLGEVPSFGSAVINMGVDKGFFASHGIKLDISMIDAGPTVITSTIQGSYDVSVAASFPMFLAVAKGAPLRAVAQLQPVEPNQGDSGLLVKPGSGITSYKDLAGKTIATNALTSLTTLATQVAMHDNGADYTTLKVTSLPFPQDNQAVSQGQADGSVVLEPFVHQGVAAGLQSIGDPIGNYIPRGSAYGIVMTSAKTDSTKAAAIKNFVAALSESEAYANTHHAEFVKDAEKALGLSAKLANALPIPTWTPKFDVNAMQKLADIMVQYKYLSKPLNVSKYLPAG